MVSPKEASTREDMVHSGDDHWMERAGHLSQAFNKLIAKSACKMCNLYVDEQVEFEIRQEDYSTAMAKAWMRAYKPSLEVEVYRQMLFDEDSVVFNASEREEEERLSPSPLHAAGSFDPRLAARCDDGTVSTQKS